MKPVALLLLTLFSLAYTFSVGLAQTKGTTNLPDTPQSPAIPAADMANHVGLFMVLKAKPTMRGKLLTKLHQFSEAIKQSRSGPTVFIVHTFASEPELAYIYVLDETSKSTIFDPLVRRIKQEGEAYIATTTLYPLNPLFGKFPR